MKEDSITFKTGQKCPLCQSVVLYNAYLHKYNFKNNGIMGPGFHSSYDEDLIELYFCEKCGHTLVPTRGNNLLKDSKKRQKNCLILFQETRPGIIKKSLKIGQIFKEIKNKENYESVSGDILNFFKKGHKVRFFRDFSNKESRRSFNEMYPQHFIVGEKLICWAEYIQVEHVLSEEEKLKRIEDTRKFLSSIKPKKVSEEMSISEEEYISSKQTTTKTEKNKPLPKGAVLAVKVIIPEYGNDHFYIPENCLQF